MNLQTSRISKAVMAGAWSLAIGMAANTAEARITKIVIAEKQSPTFEGATFGAGQYEKLRGKAYGEVDPKDRRNAGIVDIALAPVNVNGKVEYSMDILILKPINLTKGNSRVLLDLNNRGTVRGLASFNDAVGSNDPASAAHAGNGFLMNQGFAIVTNGWDITPTATPDRPYTITVPVARNPDGSSITGPSLDELVVDNATTTIFPLSYTTATPDKSAATLTVRNHYADTPVPVPSSGWEYVDAKSIRLAGGAKFAIGSLYEFAYQAKDPVVAGLGFAAIRDFTTFLKTATADDFGTPNPLAAHADHVFTFSVSQPSRTLRDFIKLGFNEPEKAGKDSDEKNGKSGQNGQNGPNGDSKVAIDGILNWIGGGSGIFMNYRFAQPSRTHRQHIARWFPEERYPDQDAYDPVTRQHVGMLRACKESDTCPKIFELNSENEYWAKAGSALHTDANGRDLQDPENVRIYLLSGAPHSAGTAAGICQQPQNPIRPNVVIRALIGKLDNWVSQDSHGRSGKSNPPDSLVPMARNGTLVQPAQNMVGFPGIPGVTYNGRLHEGDLYDFGPEFATRGIISINPPIFRGTPYPALVPKTDKDGNDIAGIRLPEVEVPIATFTGWGLRSGPASPDGCDASGQRIPFASTRAQRDASGDPRLSLEERYGSQADYANKVLNAARKLQSEGFMLEADVQEYYNAALATPLN